MNRNYTSARRTRRSPGYRGRKSYHTSGDRNKRSRTGRHGQYIDPKRFIKAAKPVEEIAYEPLHTFNDFDINDHLKRNLIAKGYTIPTQIQDKAIPEALMGHDIIGIANTGTGKTASFLLPLLNNLMANPQQRALIVAPTRELAGQIVEECRAFSRGSKLHDVLLIGGVNIGPQLRDLKRGPKVIIGTPGRIKDHIERKTLRLDNVSTIVLDEVDRMLDMGFINDIRSILAKLPTVRQSFFFSATMSQTIENLINTFTDKPVKIMARTAETSDNVEQSITHYFENKDRLDKLHDLLITDPVERVLIFCETKRGTDKLSKELNTRGFRSDSMHGNKSQSQRQRALRKFKSGDIDILVATDVAARGIDVDNITHVINYDIPQTYDDYTHRIGRTGRAGTKGYAVTFITH